MRDDSGRSAAPAVRSSKGPMTSLSQFVLVRAVSSGPARMGKKSGNASMVTKLPPTAPGKTDTSPVPEKLPPRAPGCEGDCGISDVPIPPASSAVSDMVPTEEPSIESGPLSHPCGHSSVLAKEQGNHEHGEEATVQGNQAGVPHRSRTLSGVVGAHAVAGIGTTESNQLHLDQRQAGLSTFQESLTFSARVVSDEEGPRQAHQQEGSSAVQQMQSDSAEPVYEGVALPPSGNLTEHEHKTGSACVVALRKYRMNISILALFCTVVAAVVVPILVTSRGQSMRTATSTSATSSTHTTTPSTSTTSSGRFSYFKSLVLSKLEEASISSGVEALEDNTSPQHAALLWVADEDELQLNWNDDMHIVQRFVLATLYFAMGGGDFWFFDLHFLSGEHECMWNDRTSQNGVFCADNATVDEIVVIFNNITGTLPEELGLLESLEYLDFHFNELYGPIPPSLFRNLKKLQELHLSKNFLSGPIPTSIGELSKIAFLDLSDNYLSGKVPSKLKLRELQFLYLANNKISGTLAFAADSFPKLEEISLYGNELTGTLPKSLFSFENLTVLYLDENSLTGTLPSEVGNLVHLQDLSLWKNSYRGPIPEEIGSLVELRFLDLGQNRFTGTVPDSIGQMKNLQLLVLNMNRLSGTFPLHVANLTKLRYLVLSRNNFNGTVPDIFEPMMEDLIALLLDANEFSGPIPPSLGQLINLTYFSIANTSMTGDLAFLCKDSVFEVAMADCYGDSPEVSCDCCDVCCSDYETSSNLTADDIFPDGYLFGNGRLPGCFFV